MNKDVLFAYMLCLPHTYFFFFFFLIQFNVPFKIISLIETSQSIGGRNGRTPGKPPDTPASRTWLVSHVASAGLEPTPDTAVAPYLKAVSAGPASAGPLFLANYDIGFCRAYL